jgi:hypothetical protein
LEKGGKGTSTYTGRKGKRYLYREEKEEVAIPGGNGTSTVPIPGEKGTGTCTNLKIGKVRTNFF